MARPLIPIFDNFGGLFTEGESTTRPPGSAGTCTNMRVGRGGKTLRKFHGASRWSANQVVADEPVLGITQFHDKAGQVHEVARIPSGYYERNLGTDVWASLKATNREDDGIPMFASIYGRLHVVDGYNAYVYDVTQATQWDNWISLTAPQSGVVNATEVRPRARATSGGTLTKDAEYEVFFTFADGTDNTKESPPSEIMRVRTTETNETVTISTGYAGHAAGTPKVANSFFHLPSDVASANTPNVNAYISAANTPGVWYRGSQTSAAKADETEIEVTITADSTSDQFTTFHGPPTYATGVVLHHSRLWVWGSPAYPTRIWFTELETAQTFKAANFIDIGVDKPEDPVRACIPYGTGGGAELLILKLNSVWRLTGNDISTFVAQMVHEGPSCLSDRAVARGPDNAIYWAGYEACYRYDGGVVQNLTDGKIRDTWRASNGLVAVE